MVAHQSKHTHTHAYTRIKGIHTHKHTLNSLLRLTAIVSGAVRKFLLIFTFRPIPPLFTNLQNFLSLTPRCRTFYCSPSNNNGSYLVLVWCHWTLYWRSTGTWLNRHLRVTIYHSIELLSLLTFNYTTSSVRSRLIEKLTKICFKVKPLL